MRVFLTDKDGKETKLDNIALVITECVGIKEMEIGNSKIKEIMVYNRGNNIMKDMHLVFWRIANENSYYKKKVYFFNELDENTKIKVLSLVRTKFFFTNGFEITKKKL